MHQLQRVIMSMRQAEPIHRTYEFTKIVDRLRQEGGDGEVVGAHEALFGCQVFSRVDACEIEQGVAVVGRKASFCLGTQPCQYARRSRPTLPEYGTRRSLR